MTWRGLLPEKIKAPFFNLLLQCSSLNMVGIYLKINRWMRPSHRTSNLGSAANQMHGIKTSLIAAMVDCSGFDADLLCRRIELASNPKKLWSLRSNAYSIISKNHYQSIADLRISKVTAAFEKDGSMLSEECWCRPDVIGRP